LIRLRKKRRASDRISRRSFDGKVNNQTIKQDETVEEKYTRIVVENEKLRKELDFLKDNLNKMEAFYKSEFGDSPKDFLIEDESVDNSTTPRGDEGSSDHSESDKKKKHKKRTIQN